MIYPRGAVILADRLVGIGEGRSNSSPQVRAVDCGPKRIGEQQHAGFQIRDLRRGSSGAVAARWVAAAKAARQQPQTGVGGGNKGNGTPSQPLAQSFVIAKDERLILPNRPPQSPSELISLEWRDASVIEKVPSVQVAV